MPNERTSSLSYSKQLETSANSTVAKSGLMNSALLSSNWLNSVPDNPMGFVPALLDRSKTHSNGYSHRRIVATHAANYLLKRYGFGKHVSESDYHGLRIQLLADAGAALLVLLSAITLSVYKPWGRTPYGLPKKIINIKQYFTHN